MAIGNPSRESHIVQVRGYFRIDVYERPVQLSLGSLGLEAQRELLLQEYQLPKVNIQQIITTQTPAEGLFRAGLIQRYYRVEPMITREGIAAMLVLEDFPFFTRVLRERIVVALGATLGLLVVLASIVAIVVRRGIAQP